MATMTLTFEQLEATIAARYAAEARVRELEAQLAGVALGTKKRVSTKTKEPLTEEQMAEAEAIKKANIAAGQAKRKETLAAKKAAAKEAEHLAWLANMQGSAPKVQTFTVTEDEGF